MRFFSRKMTPALAALILAMILAMILTMIVASSGCFHPAPPAPPKPAKPAGVTTNSGGDTRGTILYHPPATLPKPASDPYAAVSSKFVIGQRQRMAWALAEIDDHAHLQALHTYPVPDPTWRGYTKEKALAQALRQAQFNAYLLEKHHAHFCNQFGLTYDQMILIIKEGRQKNWPMPPPPKDE